MNRRLDNGIDVDDRSTSDDVLGPYKNEGFEEALNFSGHVEGDYVHGLAVRDGMDLEVKMLSENNHPIEDNMNIQKEIRSEIVSAFEDDVGAGVNVSFDLA